MILLIFWKGNCLMTSLSGLIRVMRKKALLSQEDFAKALNVSVGTINRWENAKTNPNITAMKKIKTFCEKNNIPFDEIEAAWIAQKE